MVDVLLVSLGSTAGLREADEQLVASLERAGASVALVSARPPRARRTLALTDYVWARAARAAAIDGIRAKDPRTVLYSTITAALLWPVPGAIRFDTLAASNRPGRHGPWQRPLERRRLRQASLLVPWSAQSLGAGRVADPRVVVVGVAVEPSGPLLPADERDIAAITYAADPRKKGLETVLEAWRLARREGEELVVAGIARAGAPAGVRYVGLLAQADYRALVRRSRAYLTAPRREDHGIAQLEALADGCMLVTTPAPGPYAALELARELDSRLVAEDLAPAIRAALDDPRRDYALRAASAVAAFGAKQIDAVVAGELLPRLNLPA
ncbi:MAG: glycosyltransferase [Solirubrobacteraceae bacterium]|jgi:glycosyltransferase involved in cell wall biosynthesis